MFADGRRPPEMAKVAKVSWKFAKRQRRKATQKEATPGLGGKSRTRSKTRRAAFLQQGDQHELSETVQRLMNRVVEARSLFNKLVVKDTNGRWCRTRDHSQFQDSVRGQFVPRSPKSA